MKNEDLLSTSLAIVPAYYNQQFTENIWAQVFENNKVVWGMGLLSSIASMKLLNNIEPLQKYDRGVFIGTLLAGAMRFYKRVINPPIVHNWDLVVDGQSMQTVKSEDHASAFSKMLQTYKPDKVMFDFNAGKIEIQTSV